MSGLQSVKVTLYILYLAIPFYCKPNACELEDYKMGFIFYYDATQLCRNSYTTCPNIENRAPFPCNKIAYIHFVYVMQPILNINLLVTNSKQHIIAAKFKIDNTKKFSQELYIRCCVNVITFIYAFLCTRGF